MIQSREQQPIMEYVVGYCFGPDFFRVALIEKAKPTWQKGKLNGVGGKVEPGETPMHAMVREFEEEAGVLIPRWLHIRTEQFTAGQEAEREQKLGARVHHFATRVADDLWGLVRTQEAEPIVKVRYPLSEITTDRVIYNLPYLIPMAAILLQQPYQNRPLP